MFFSALPQSTGVVVGWSGLIGVSSVTRRSAAMISCSVSCVPFDEADRRLLIDVADGVDHLLVPLVGLGARYFSGISTCSRRVVAVAR